MDVGQAWSRRRRDATRTSRVDRTISNDLLACGREPLLHWRQALLRMESEAARYHLGEIEMLLGAAVLAIEDAVKARQRSQS